ncbi:glycosyltransferase family 2 protein [Cryobacterium psychrophilum]|uniref:Glycosyltransferase family 2 protein n=1 Tax=Cryobacterium psychrophilum TaxID=41988 RepID=A0A4Y8KUW0_9MICO|nr:glycosyl transferase family 2 [Cryobacterium psychrophilum]TFD81882.1 glycosyltransferase family 2 protein [Cryobacterium psychrophilum]
MWHQGCDPTPARRPATVRILTSVSVVMAAYNSEYTIGDAIRSVQNQTFLDWELIIVDDASTDRTPDMVRPFLEDPKIQMLVQPMNMGAGAARNTGIGRSKADLIAILDADDLSLPHRLQMQFEEMIQHPQMAVLSGHLAEFGTWGGPIVHHWPVASAEIQARIRRSKMPVAHGASMFRKAAFLAVGGYDENCRRAEDFALFRKLRASEFGCVDSVLLLYRTVRPISLQYALVSGRDGRLARVRNRDRFPRPSAKLQALPMSAPTDLRSIITWARRRFAERVRFES